VRRLRNLGRLLHFPLTATGGVVERLEPIDRDTLVRLVLSLC
jgi:hypothetical protein